MNTVKQLLATAALFSIVFATGCKKDDSNPANGSVDAFIQVDAAKNAPVTQKTDPYNTGQKFSSIFATTTLDLTTKVGSNTAISQTMLVYQISQKSNVEIEAITKTLLQSIPDGGSKTIKIMGDDSRFSGTGEGFMLGGNVSAGTGAWDMAYTAKPDIDMKVSRSGTKYTFLVASPIAVNYIKRGGAGNPDYPSFDATTQFAVQVTIQ